jgi:hypothetical protein
MWLQDSDWSRQVRAFLEEWTGEELSNHCGTDRASLERRTSQLRAAGYPRIDIVEHSYDADVDFPYIAGHLQSAMSESSLPHHRREEFAAGLRDALQPCLDAGRMAERIDATAVIAISHEATERPD